MTASRSSLVAWACLPVNLLKEASDCNFNIVAVGLLYRYGYFQQRISITGDQIASYAPQKFAHLSD